MGTQKKTDHDASTEHEPSAMGEEKSLSRSGWGPSRILYERSPERERVGRCVEHHAQMEATPPSKAI